MVFSYRIYLMVFCMQVLPDVVSSWKKCAIHVFIGHLIKNYQEKEECKTLLLSEVSRPMDGSKLCATENDEKVGLQNSVAERNKHEGRVEVLCDRRYMSAHQSSVSSDAKQKKVVIALSFYVSCCS